MSNLGMDCTAMTGDVFFLRSRGERGEEGLGCLGLRDLFNCGVLEDCACVIDCSQSGLVDRLGHTLHG